MSTLSKELAAAEEEAKVHDYFWVEDAKMDFALSLEAQRRRADMTYKAVADKLGTSAAYITKVFRGDVNMTIETMVKLTRATGGHLDIRISEPKSDTGWDVSRLAAASARAASREKAPFSLGTATTVVMAANHARFFESAAA